MGHAVPETVQRAVANALDRHRQHPLDGVTGLSVAERLAAGEVEDRDIVSMHRFFTVHDRAHLAERQHARDATSSALCRSWDLRGAERGRAWVDRIYRSLVSMGEVREDPYDDLMTAEPDEVYAMFGSGAYGWEFGLDTMSKAAKFVEDYHRATGYILDLQRAFGESGKAVAVAMLRRVSKPDPMVLGRQLQDSYEVARRDTDALAEMMSDRPVFEIMRSTGLPIVRMAKGVSWPEWVAFCATTSEARGQPAGPLSGVFSPTHGPRSQALHETEGVERMFLTFFDPDGPCYVEDADTEHEGIHEELRNWLTADQPETDRDYLIDLTERLMHWCEITGRNASLSRTYVEAWRRRDWKTIAESIPLDSPHRSSFLLIEDRDHADPLGPASTLDGSIAGQPGVPDEVEDPAWKLGDVIRNGNRTFYVFAQDGDQFVLAPLYIDSDPSQASTPVVTPARNLTGYRVVMHDFQSVDHGDTVAWLAPEITAEPPNVKLDEIPAEWGNVGDELQLDDRVAYLLGAVEGENDERFTGGAMQGRIRTPRAIVATRRESQWGPYWSIETVPGRTMDSPVNQSYYPTGMFERPTDTPDDEIGDHRFVATPMAEQFAARIGAKLSRTSAEFHLGLRFKLDDERTRTVIGFASKDGKSGYILVSEKGNLTWKTAERAHREFTGKPRSYLQSVIRNSIPHPDAHARTVETWRWVNYTLSDRAKTLARAHGWKLVRSPSESRFLVGVPLRGAGGTTSILCWVEGRDEQTFTPNAVLDAPDGFSLATLEELEMFEIAYERESAVEPESGLVTLARRGKTVNVMHELFALPTSIDSFATTPILETAFPWIPKRRHVYAGIIGVVPAGTKLSFGGSVYTLDTNSLVFLRPLGDVGAKLVIPRGPVAPDDAVAQSAAESTFRQTGIAMQPHTHVGDFESDMTLTRVYTGTIIGGDPHAKRPVGEGADAVVIAQLDATGEPQGWLSELDGMSWQVRAVREAVRMLGYNRVDAKRHVRVTGPQDTPSGRPVPSVAQPGTRTGTAEKRPVFVSQTLTPSVGLGNI